jgi:guanylate cyclase soluble subunit alpha
LTSLDDFVFEFTPRDPSNLPKEYPAAPGETCYFIDGYKHKGIESDETQKHIDAAMEQINAEVNEE